MLPKVKNTVPVYQRETIPFLGLNRSDDVREGEFSAQKNISNRRYPYLAPRLSRSGEQAGGADALFSWDGAEIVAAEGRLLCGGESLCNVSGGPKQFAVVNTKLVVWPDKLTVDLTNRKVAQLDAQAVSKGEVTISGASITTDPDGAYTTMTGMKYISKSGEQPWAYTYTSLSWTENGWSAVGGTWVNLFAGGNVGRYYIPSATYNERSGRYTFGWPDTTWAASRPDDSRVPEYANAEGFYGRLEEFALVTASADYLEGAWDARIYWAQWALDLSEVFAAGDVVTVTGTRLGFCDVERKKIVSVDKDTNTVTFADGTLERPEAYCYTSEQWEAGTHQLQYKDGKVTTGYEITLAAPVPAGQYIILNGERSAFYIWDGKEILATCQAKSTERSGISMTRYTPGTGITIRREVPELDFICEHDNRLWGVSSKDRTIFASALGDPCNFYDYSGDAGSYAVAVGSEGDFAAVCSYGGAVLCWKERTLHKILGDVPSNYQMATFRFSGVRTGAHKSLVNVNETLFFLGVDGVYAYSGNKPSLISRALGTDVLKDGVGGTDGRAYYLSVKNGDSWELLSYDTHAGLWARWDETQVVDFCRVGDRVKFLSGETVYTIGAGDESMEWEAVFVPMYETLEGGKQYNRLIFRVEVPTGGYVAADVRFDGRPWKQVGIVKGKSGPVHVPVPLRRCDKFQIRLRGKGDCAVLDMVREFRLRGEG